MTGNRARDLRRIAVWFVFWLALGAYQMIGLPGIHSPISWMGVLVALGSCLYLLVLTLYLRSPFRAASLGKFSKAKIAFLLAYAIVTAVSIMLLVVEPAREARPLYVGAALIWFFGVGFTLLVLADVIGVRAP